MATAQDPRPANLLDIWEQCVARFPSKVGAVAEGEPHTYASLDGRVRSLAGAMADRFGLAKGERVIIEMRNSLAFFLAYWAAHRLGAIVGAVSPRLARREAAYVVRELSTDVPNGRPGRVLFCDADFDPPTEGTAVEYVIDGEEVLAMADSGASLPPGVQSGTGGAGRKLPGSGPDTAGDDLAVLAHTSGTTGEPKIAGVTHGDLLFNLKVAVFAHSLRHEDVILVGVPMFHCTPLYSLLPGAAYLGATLVITSETKPGPMAEIARRDAATVWFGIPTFFHQLAVAKSVDDAALEGLRLLAYAGSPMRPETVRRVRGRFRTVALHNFFGLTETISMTHVLPSADALSHADSIGKLLPEVYARIVAEEKGAATQMGDVPPGEVGELCFHRSNVIRAYWGKPGLLEESFFTDESGDWFRTGDRASCDEQGYFRIRGRSKDMIITAGENVYAAEVEAVLRRHPGVEDVAVVGVPATGVRTSLGELVKAVIVPAEGKSPTATEIKRFGFEHLTSYKVPQIVEFVRELPRNAAGKVLKSELVRPELPTR